MMRTVSASVLLVQALFAIAVSHGSAGNSGDQYMTVNFQIIVRCPSASISNPAIIFQLQTDTANKLKYEGQGVFNNYCENRYAYFDTTSMIWEAAFVEDCCWTVTRFELIYNSETLRNDSDVQIYGKFYECDQKKWLCFNDSYWFEARLTNFLSSSESVQLPNEASFNPCSVSKPSMLSSSPVLCDISSSVEPSINTGLSSLIPSPSPIPPVPTRSFGSSTIIPSLPLPSQQSCPAESDIWQETDVGSSASGSCFMGSVEAIRFCLPGGLWNDPICNTPDAFLAIINETITNSSVDGLESLRLQVMGPTELTEYQEAYLLYSIYLLQLNTSQVPVSFEFSQNFIDVASDLLEISVTENLSPEELRSIGSLLLLTLDEFALNLHDPNQPAVDSENIVLRVLEVQQPTEPVTAIEIKGNSIVLPTEIFTTNSSVRIASFYFSNLSLLLQPEGNASVASPVISSTTDCNECRTQELDTNVTITFTLPQENLPRNPERYNDSLFCVHWDFAEVGEEDPPTGSWNQSGCYITRREGTVIVCECNHLTHFAILLSPGVEVSSTDEQILTIIGYVFVPISLVCLLLTMITYVSFRTLWSMRSYVHVMLCGSMFAAQLLFVVGVERTENQYVCAGISVVLLYLFLVTFMWMLMEGVVLYVALVRVFVTYTARYLMAFTVASYGIPALYLAVVVPIGFTINGGNNFLYLDKNGDLQACWLNYNTHFIWVFISPVLAIIITNIAFLVMSLVVMCRHQKSEPDKTKLAAARYWSRAILSLVVVMGIAWLFNVLFFIEQLIFVAYIVTVFIAAQGLIIFLLFVVLSKQTREAYWRWWQNKKAQSEFLSKLSWSAKSTGASSLPMSKEKDMKDIITCDHHTPGSFGAMHGISEEPDVETADSIPGN